MRQRLRRMPQIILVSRYDWSGNGNHASAYNGTPEFKTNLGINSIYFDGGDSLKLDSLPQALGMTNENADGYEIYMAINHENTGPGFVLAAGLGHRHKNPKLRLKLRACHQLNCAQVTAQGQTDKRISVKYQVKI